MILYSLHMMLKVIEIQRLVLPVIGIQYMQNRKMLVQNKCASPDYGGTKCGLHQGINFIFSSNKVQFHTVIDRIKRIQCKGCLPGSIMIKQNVVTDDGTLLEITLHTSIALDFFDTEMMPNF